MELLYFGEFYGNFFDHRTIGRQRKIQNIQSNYCCIHLILAVSLRIIPLAVKSTMPISKKPNMYMNLLLKMYLIKRLQGEYENLNSCKYLK